MRHFTFTLVAILLCCIPCFSQNGLLGGFVRIEPKGDCTTKILEVVLTAIAPEYNYSDGIQVFWGDGTSETLSVSSPGSYPTSGIVTYLYRGEHQYDGTGSYALRVEGCCLASGFANVPNSGSVPLQLSLIFQVFNGQFQGCNGTPFLIQPVVDYGVVNRPMIFNPNAYDPNGDSLSFQIVDPLPEHNYLFPDEVVPGPGNQFSIDGRTGTITWDSPHQAGRYLVGLMVEEHRHGVRISESVSWITFEISDLDVLIFPNPVATDLTIGLTPGVWVGRFGLTVHNVLGQVVLHEEGEFLNGKHTVSVRDWANGTYFLTVQAFDRTWTKKFIKT